MKKQAMVLCAIPLALAGITSAAQDRVGNGGDACEARIIEIRDALDAWIVRGIGPKNLRLPAGVSVDSYSTAMREAMGDRSVKISCVTGPVYLNPEIKTDPKTCVSWQGGGVRTEIVCDREAFMKGTSPEDQYVLVHHEYATMAQLDSGERLERTSDYAISIQLKSLLKDPPLTVAHGTASTQRPSPVEGPLGTKWVSPIQQCEFDKRMGRNMPGLVNGNCREFYYGEKLQPRKLTRDFEIMTTEVTQLQWFRVTGKNPSSFSRPEHCPKEHSPTVRKIEGFTGCPNHPVEQVSYHELRRFVAGLQYGNTDTFYFVPQEVEWEYAARAGSKAAYSFGDEAERLIAYGWFDGNSLGQSHAVGRLRSNQWGLFDMHGNIKEWTVNSDPGGDPSGYVSGPSHVIRGGSFLYSADKVRSTFRMDRYVDPLNLDTGFRVARTRIR